MLDIAAQNAMHSASAPHTGGKKRLTMVPHDRMAGSIPVWTGAPQGPAAKATAAPESSNFRSALAAADPENPAGSSFHDDSFGFADLLDMINPLQHIPVLNQIYRELSGDTIKPVSKVIGGAVFGGPVGAAGGLVNVIVEEETGRDVTGNAVAMVFRGETPSYRSDAKNPEVRLEAALASAEESARRDLPAELLAFAAAPVSTPEPVKTAAKMLHNDSSRYNS